MIDGLLLLSRFLLAAVFTVAAVAKLIDREGARRALADFGVPDGIVSPSATLLCFTELAVAIALLPITTAWWGALGALALLALFITAIAASLLHGRRPECHCFGQVHSAPIGWGTVGRNGALLAIAAFVLSRGRGNSGASVGAWATGLTLSQRVAVMLGAAGFVLLVGMSWLVLLLWRQQGRLLLRIDALERGNGRGAMARLAGEVLPIGSAAPEFSLHDLRGERRTLASLRANGRPVLLLFTDPNCTPCTALLPDVARWHRELGERLTFALVSRGNVKANRANATTHGLAAVLLQHDFEVAAVYGVERTPSAVLIEADGTIGSPVASGAEAITVVVARATYVQTAATNGGAAHRPRKEPVRAGQRVPDLTLPDLHGQATRLRDFRGRDTLLLFWNPSCVFCERMLPDLTAWEAQHQAGAPRLVLISSGSRAMREDTRLSALILLDEEFAAGASFGVDGTPSAVLIDTVGNVASEPALGAPAILEMARRTQSSPTAARYGKRPAAPSTR